MAQQEEYRTEATKTSIRIQGLRPRWGSKPQRFDRTFYVGDHAIYGAYNLTYTGPILSIGPKAVTIQECGNRRTRMTHRDFAWWNWDYDAEAISRHNADELMCI